MRWLFSTYSRAEITDWVRQWGRFGLPAPHLAFWRLTLGLAEAHERPPLAYDFAIHKKSFSV